MKPYSNWLKTDRIGQLTGSTRTEKPKWTRTVDSMGRPLLNDTGRWGVVGADLGANTEHNGRLFIFTGDVAIEQDPGFPGYGGDPKKYDNADLVAWTEDREVLHHGGHLEDGWNFILPNDHQGGTAAIGQPDWRFCGKCGSLFWAPEGSTAGSACFRGGEHDPIGWSFFLPNLESGASGATGQVGWRFCGKCHGLFWSPDGHAAGVCPRNIGLPSKHDPVGWTFVLPNKEQGTPLTAGQPEWRFCANCKGLFWGGGAFKGLCTASSGGGFHLQATLRPAGDPHAGIFEPITAGEPIGITNSLEVPSGAFSHLGRAYVFVNLGEPHKTGRARDGDPQAGTYLISKSDPRMPGTWTKEFLFSPRIGCCPKDANRDLRESHEVRGLRFVLPHVGDASPGSATLRRCLKCETLYFADGTQSPCWKGGTHDPDSLSYTPARGTVGDAQLQDAWRRCRDCNSVFWDGEAEKGLCPAAGNHRASDDAFLMPYISIGETAKSQKNWRFCVKCAGLFYWDGNPEPVRMCPRDGGNHEAMGFDFVLPHDIPADAQSQGDWRFCVNCHGLFWDGDPAFKGVCPHNGGDHSHGNVGYHFVPRRDVAGDALNQADWRFCLKCAGLFFAGGDRGICKKDGHPHDHGNVGFNFVLAHNPGEDRNNDGGWRFCRKCHGMVRANQREHFSGVAAFKVDNARHDLPERTGSGLVMMSKSFWKGNEGRPGFRLAWMPLSPSEAPKFQETLYYAGLPGGWSENPFDAATVVEHQPQYTSVSIAWLDGPQCWILLYSDAHDQLTLEERKGPVMARFSTDLREWSAPTKIFDPKRERAYGEGGVSNYMHLPGQDPINFDIPPLQMPTEDPNDPPETREDKAGWAYGAFILERFTRWDEETRRLNMHYLMSTSSPYHIHLMYSEVSLRYFGDYLYLKSLADRLFGKTAQLIAALQLEEARSIGAEAVEVYQLAAGAPRPDVIAVTQQLLSLSSQWANTSHPLEAVPPAQAAVAVIREVEPPPAGAELSYLSKLSEAWFVLTLRLIEAARVEEALTPALETIAAYRLAAATPRADVVAIAQQLLFLSSHLANAPPPATAAAVAPAQAAVDVLRGFAPVPGAELAYRSRLAEAWFTFTLRLIEAARVEEALTPALETTAAYRLAAATPGADVVAIAQQLLFLSSHLANAHPPATAAAVAPAQAAVDVLHSLAPAPGGQTAMLAEACHTLAVRLKEVGRVREALPPAREAVDLYRQLVIADPVAFQVKLAAAEQLLASLEQS